jgi:hypothetical protein
MNQTQLPQISHTVCQPALAYGRAQCTDCQQPVTVNKLGNCPATLSLGWRAPKPATARVERVPVVTVAPVVVGLARARYTCNVDGHGLVTLNKVGACPKCYLAQSATAWSDYRAQQAAAPAPDVAAPGTPDVTGEGVEVEAKQPEPAAPEAPEIPEALALVPVAETAPEADPFVPEGEPVVPPVAPEIAVPTTGNEVLDAVNRQISQGRPRKARKHG